MKQPGSLLRPSQLPRQLHYHEVLYHGTARAVWFAEPVRVLAEQVAREREEQPPLPASPVQLLEIAEVLALAEEPGDATRRSARPRNWRA
jgi:hypothetical protein